MAGEENTRGGEGEGGKWTSKSSSFRARLCHSRLAFFFFTLFGVGEIWPRKGRGNGGGGGGGGGGREKGGGGGREKGGGGREKGGGGGRGGGGEGGKRGEEEEEEEREEKEEEEKRVEKAMGEELALLVTFIHSHRVCVYIAGKETF